MRAEECQNGAGAMEQSEDSGSLLGGEADSIDSSGWSDVVGLTDIEQISAELANRGPPQSDVKLRLVSVARRLSLYTVVFGYRITLGLFFGC